MNSTPITPGEAGDADLFAPVRALEQELREMASYGGSAREEESYYNEGLRDAADKLAACLAALPTLWTDAEYTPRRLFLPGAATESGYACSGIHPMGSDAAFARRDCEVARPDAGGVQPMKVSTRICIKDMEFVDGDKAITLKRGREYTTSRGDKDGQVFVFSHFWFWAPAEIFAGEEPLGGPRHDA